MVCVETEEKVPQSTPSEGKESRSFLLRSKGRLGEVNQLFTRLDSETL